MLTACPNHTRRDLLKQILLDLKDTNLEPLGLVINHNADHNQNSLDPVTIASSQSTSASHAYPLTQSNP